MVADAIEIGARVLEREQARGRRRVRARRVREGLARGRDRVHRQGAGRGRVLRDQGRRGLRRRERAPGQGARRGCSATGSSAAVQHQLREVMREQSARMREDLLRQFSSADGSNPLADFKAAHLRAARDAATRQEAQLEAMREQMVALKLELAGLRSEREKALEVAAEARARHGQGPARTRRPWPRRSTRSRAAWATTATRSATSAAPAGARATSWSTSTAAPAPPRGRIVFEAKNSRKSRKEALAELDEAMAQRSADYGVWVVPVRGPAAGARAGAARGRRRQAVRGLRPRGRVAAGAGGRVLAGPGARADGQGRRRGARRAGAARRGRAGAGRDGRRAPDQART